MKIGSFLETNLGKNVSYSYYHKGTKRIYNPDVLKEEFDKEVYYANDGNLFYGTEVSWKDSVLLIHLKQVM